MPVSHRTSLLSPEGHLFDPYSIFILMSFIILSSAAAVVNFAAGDLGVVAEPKDKLYRAFLLREGLPST